VREGLGCYRGVGAAGWKAERPVATVATVETVETKDEAMEDSVGRLLIR
jgi:hypothetical protein